MYEEIISKYTRKLEDLLSNRPFKFKDEAIKITEDPGIYVISDKDERIIYIGRTKNLKTRLLRNHRSGNIRGSQLRRALMKDRRLRPEDEITSYIKENCGFRLQPIEDPEERIRLEHFATAVVGPELNVKLKQ